MSETAFDVADDGVEERARRATMQSETTSGPRGRRWLAFWAPIVLVLAALTSSWVVAAGHSQQLSPLDEWVYFDYVTKIPSQGIVRQGEFIGHEALVAMACNGDSFGPRGEACGSVRDVHEAYPQGGRTTADIYTPLYFAITWAAGKVIQFFTGAEFLTAARMTGALWLAGGVLVFYRLLRLLRLPKLLSVGLGLIVIGSPMAQWSSTFVTTDAPVFLLGSLILYLTISAVIGRTSAWWLVPISVLAVWFKVTTIFAVGFAALFVLIYAIWQRKSPSFEWKKLVLPVAVAAVAGVVAQLLWLALRAKLSLGPSPSQGVETPFIWRDLAGLVTMFFNPGPIMSGGYGGIYRIPPLVFAPMQWIGIAGVIGLAAMSLKHVFERSFAIAAAIACILFAPVLALGMYFLLGQVFPVGPRYAISVAPVLLVAFALIVRNRVVERVTLAYGATLVLIVTGTSLAFS